MTATRPYQKGERVVRKDGRAGEVIGVSHRGTPFTRNNYRIRWDDGRVSSSNWHNDLSPGPLRSVTLRTRVAALVRQHLALPTATEACLRCWQVLDPATAHPCGPASRMPLALETTRQTATLLQTL